VKVDFYDDNVNDGPMKHGFSLAFLIHEDADTLQTCYSITSPAEKSGIIGFKLTRGLLSSEEIIHAFKRLDTVGVLTHTVSNDMLLTLGIVQ
jgi:hypothetical protein